MTKYLVTIKEVVLWDTIIDAVDEIVATDLAADLANEGGLALSFREAASDYFVDSVEEVAS